MAVPEAVKRQADAAEAEYQKRYGNTASPTPGAIPAQPVTPPAATTPPAPAATPPAPVTTPAPSTEPDWKHRYHVIQGKYNAEVPRLQESVRQMQASMQQMSEQLRASTAAKPLITPEEVTNYGEGLTDYIKRASREALAPVVAQIEQRMGAFDAIPKHVETLQQRTFDTQRAAFFAGLNSSVPDWEAVNTTPAFLQWLEQVDPLARRTRQSMLEAAQNDFDVNGVAAFFHQWKATQGSASRPAEAPIVPPQGQNNPPPVNQQTAKKIWTEQEIAQFYDAVRRNRVPKADVERIEQEINVAAQEGRVRTR
jgi:DNA-binding protein YbaB